MLSARARGFLITLERRPFIPTREVEAIIRDQRYPCFAPWLDFHDKYAGYLDRFGRDYAVWGLVHERPQWLLPRRADIDREPNEEVWYITCADCHPSYTYRLDDKGEFLGDPADSFDIHVERIALGWDFYRRGRCRALGAGELKALQDTTFTGMVGDLVAEASDRFSRYYMNKSYLLRQQVATGRLRQGSINESISGAR